MKFLGILLLTLVLGIAPAYAQDESVETVEYNQDSVQQKEEPAVEEDDWSSEPYVIQAGPYIGIASAGINTEDIAAGRKTNVDFWFVGNYGASIYAPFGAGSKLGGRLDIGVSSTGTRTRPYEVYDGKTNWEGYFIERYQMFSVAPRISLSGVTLGVGFNFMMKGERWNPNSEDEPHVIDINLMKSMVMDFRLGGMIKAWQTDLGTLYAEIEARWMLGGLYNDDSYYYGMDVNNRGAPTPAVQTGLKNLTPASAHIGISYLFNLGL